MKHGKVTRGRLGVTVQEVNAALAESFGLDRAYGALVSSVDPSSPASKAGLQVGDVIVKYAGKPIEHSSDLPMLVGDTAPGEQASIEVWRKAGSKTLTVVPTESKEARVAGTNSVAGGDRQHGCMRNARQFSVEQGDGFCEKISSQRKRHPLRRDRGGENIREFDE